MPRTGAAHLPSLDEALIRMSDGLAAIDTVKKLMADLGLPHDNLYEVALWEDMMRVERDEAFYPYMVDNQAIVIPQTIDAIRALTGRCREARQSIARTDAALGIGSLAGRLSRGDPTAVRRPRP